MFLFKVCHDQVVSWYFNVLIEYSKQGDNLVRHKRFGTFRIQNGWQRMHYDGAEPVGVPMMPVPWLIHCERDCNFGENKTQNAVNIPTVCIASAAYRSYPRDIFFPLCGQEFPLSEHQDRTRDGEKCYNELTTEPKCCGRCAVQHESQPAQNANKQSPQKRQIMKDRKSKFEEKFQSISRKNLSWPILRQVPYA